MPSPIDVTYERTFNGTPKRIFQLLSEMGTSQDAIWPMPTTPFMRSPGPLVPGTTEEWHLGMHAVLATVEPEKTIVWKIDNEGIEGTHGFSIEQDGRKVTVRHRTTAMLSDQEGRMFWRRIEDAHERAMTGLFDKMGRVLKR